MAFKPAGERRTVGNMVAKFNTQIRFDRKGFLGEEGKGREDLGFRIWDLGFGIWDLGFRIWDLGFRIWDLGFRI